MRRHLGILALALVLAAGLVVLTQNDPATPPRAPGDKEIVGFDEPDLAHEFFLRERVAPGREVDFYQRYAAARRHMAAMPRTLAGRVERETKAAGPEIRGRWRSLGPGNIGGRTRTIVFHPTRPETIYTAGVAGGIWKSVDGGRHWRALSDLLPNVRVFVLAMDPEDPQVLYAGTGEGVFPDEDDRGAGIFKTTDAGVTWTRLAATAGKAFRFVNDIVISREDSQRLYAATRAGVLRSLDGGETWKLSQRSELIGGCLDLALLAGAGGEALLSSCGTFEPAVVSKNAAAATSDDWQVVLTEADMGRTALAVAPSDPNVVYALGSSLGLEDASLAFGLHALFRSDQGGDAGTWTATVRNVEGEDRLNRAILSRARSVFRQECFDSDGEPNYRGQSWYDLALAVDPVDPDVVFVGGINLYRSDDGGANWGQLSYWFESPPSAHADHHAIVFHPGYDGDSNQVMLVGNDGGVWRTQNARAPSAVGETAACSIDETEVLWESLNWNYAVTQFYHGLPFPDGRAYIGGTQDNGTVFGDDAGGLNRWVEVFGGDGGYVAIDPDRPNIVYVESQFFNLFRVDFDTGTIHFGQNGITEPRSNFLFITPYLIDPNNSRRLWTGGRRIWRTNDRADSWTAASVDLGARVSALAVAPGQPNRVVVGLVDGRVVRTDQAFRTGPETRWPSSRVTRAPASISWLAYDPSDVDVVYATSSLFDGNHAFQSVDGGATWRAIDGAGANGLPRIPAHTIVVDPDDPDRLFVGTDLGVFVSTTGGRRWAVENSGFSNTIVQSLSLLRRPRGQYDLYAFTHGRGAWRVTLR